MSTERLFATDSLLPQDQARPIAKARRGSGRIRTFVRWALPLAALILVSRAVRGSLPEIREAMAIFKGRGAAFMFAALIIETAWVLTLSEVYRSSLMAFGGASSHRGALRVSMGAFTLSRVLPGGGAIGALLAGREFIRIGNPGPVTLLALVSAGWVSLTVLALLVCAGVVIGALSGSLSPALLPGPVAIASALSVGGLLATKALSDSGWRHRVFRLVEKLFSKWHQEMSEAEFENAVRRVRTTAFLKIALWAGLGWVLDGAALWAVFAAFGHHLDMGVLALGYGVANLIQALPEMTPGWLGVLEGTLSITYASLGIPVGVSVVVILGYRLVSFWLPVLAGVPSALAILRGSDMPGHEGRQL